MAVPFADLFALPIPDGVADEEAVLLTDILPTGYLGALRPPSSRVPPSSSWARAGRDHGAAVRRRSSARRGILAVDVVPERLARAERLGAEPIDARIAPGSAQVLEATRGRGAESVIEAVGADATVVDAVSCAAAGGTVSVVGVNLTMDLTFPMGIVFLKSLTLRAVFAPIPGTWSCPRPAPPVGPPRRSRRDVHPPHGPQPGARGLRVVRLQGRRRLEGLAHAEPLSALRLVRKRVRTGGTCVAEPPPGDEQEGGRSGPAVSLR